MQPWLFGEPPLNRVRGPLYIPTPWDVGVAATSRPTTMTSLCRTLRARSTTMKAMRSTERLADASRRLTAPSSQGRARLMSITAEGTACGAMRALDLPETEAPHPGVSSGGVGVRVGKKNGMPTGSGSRPSSASSGAVEAECQQAAEAAHPAPARGRWKRNASRKRKPPIQRQLGGGGRGMQA